MRTRLSVVALVALGVTVFLAAAPKRPPVWVLLHHVAGITTVGDTYEDQGDANAVAHQIAATADQWNVVERSQFHKKNDPFALLLVPSLHAATLTVTPDTAVVLPAQNRNGEFISPSINVGAGVSRIIIQTDISFAQREDVTKGLSLVVEYSTDGEQTWGNSTGGFGWRGGHFVDRDGTIDPSPTLTTSVENWPGLPIRVRLQTCTPIDACTPSDLTVGATVKVQ